LTNSAAASRSAPGDAEPREVHPTPTAGLRDVVHQRAGLGILTVLGEADRVDFSYLRSLRSPPATWAAHRGALAAEMDALRQLVQRYERRHLRAAPRS
jgi:hypothetical protein